MSGKAAFLGVMLLGIKAKSPYWPCASPKRSICSSRRPQSVPRSRNNEAISKNCRCVSLECPLHVRSVAFKCSVSSKNSFRSWYACSRLEIAPTPRRCRARKILPKASRGSGIASRCVRKKPSERLRPDHSSWTLSSWTARASNCGSPELRASGISVCGVGFTFGPLENGKTLLVTFAPC